MFEIIRKYNGKGQEKTVSMGLGDEATLTYLNKEVTKHPKYFGSTFEKAVKKAESKSAEKEKDSDADKEKAVK
jgi:hypothetical protein